MNRSAPAHPEPTITSPTTNGLDVDDADDARIGAHGPDRPTDSDGDGGWETSAGDDEGGKRARPTKPSAARGAMEWTLVILGAVVIAVVVKTFFIQAFYIPSPSMENTLLINDRVLVNKLSYHLHGVNRSDLIVFERVSDAQVSETKDLIKRVIGVGGDSIVIDDVEARVLVNGQAIDEPYLKPGSATHNGAISCTAAAPCVVPEHHVFVMGDNRNNSRDSRWIGTIAEDQIVGHAFVRVWPFTRLGGL